MSAHRHRMDKYQILFFHLEECFSRPFNLSQWIFMFCFGFFYFSDQRRNTTTVFSSRFPVRAQLKCHISSVHKYLQKFMSLMEVKYILNFKKSRSPSVLHQLKKLLTSTQSLNIVYTNDRKLMSESLTKDTALSISTFSILLFVSL